MTFVDSLHAWHDFFLLVGGGAATMLGLVFVAVSLAAGLPSLPKSGESEMFVSPILSQFGYAFGTAATCLAPWNAQTHFGLFMTLLGASAFVRSGWLLRAMLRRHRHGDGVQPRYWLWMGAMPFLTSLLMVVSGVCIWRTTYRPVGVIGFAVLLLDLTGVRNTWQLVVWMIGARVAQDSTKPNAS
jgi:hypothetical protein